jgi:hypothetical protein
MPDEAQTFDWTEFKKFIDEFANESDRAAVILGAAKLDALLGQILDRYFRPSLASDDELLDGDSPLSTFSSRISLCYRLGFITPDFAKSLHQVRKIRNSFAHELSGCSLDAGPQSDRLKALLLPLKPLSFFEAFRKHFFGESVSPSINFRVCLSLMVARLEHRLMVTQQVSSDEAWSFITTAWLDTEVANGDKAEGKP